MKYVTTMTSSTQYNDNNFRHKELWYSEHVLDNMWHTSHILYARYEKYDLPKVTSNNKNY